MGSYYLNYPFNDFDYFAEIAKKWELEYFQLQSSPLNIHASQIVGKDVLSAHFYASCSFRLLGMPPLDMWTVMISSQNESAHQWLLNGRAVPENAITVYPPGYDFNNYFQAGYECYTFSMSHEYLGQLCEDNEIDELFRVLQRNDIVECSVATKDGLWRRAMEHKLRVDSLDGSEGIADMTHWHEVERELLRDILLTIAERASIRTKYNSSRIPKIFTTIDEYFEAHPFEDLTISDLSNLTGVKTRTLQHNFQKLLGVTPKQYLRAFRLNKVYKEIHRADKQPGVKIGDIALKYGFWHMGQFAMDYKKLFGELPTETLQTRITR
jgi:AraC family ethanolamine operon transcriptional activator